MATPIRRLSADRQLFGQQRVDGLEGGDLALLDPLHRRAERFERARHAQADQRGGDAIQDLGHRTTSVASRCATAS